MTPSVQELSPFEFQLFSGMTFPLYRGIGSALGKEGSPFVAFGAYVDEDPAGLCVWKLNDETDAELMSVYVKEEQRDQGIGTKLMQDSTSNLGERGRETFRVSFERNRMRTDLLRRILEKLGFEERDRQGVMCRNEGPDGISDAPWLEKNLLPNAFERFPWCQLTEDEREDILRRQEENQWFPDHRNPFNEEEILEERNSLGLRYEGEVVGWQITHRPVPDLVRYTNMHVRDDLRKFGLVIPLLVEAIRIHLGTDLAEEAPKSTFRVRPENEKMLEFVEEKMKPYLDEVNPMLNYELKRENAAANSA